MAANWRTGHSQTDQLFDDIVAALRSSGASVTDRELAVPAEQEHQDEYTGMRCELVDDLSAYLSDRPGGGVSSLADVIAYEDQFGDLEQNYFGHDLFTTAVGTGGRAGEAYAPARKRNLAWAIDACLVPGLDGVDVLIGPAYGPAWKSDLAVGGHPGSVSVATAAPSIAGWPIMSVPIGLVQELPVGLTIIGRPRSEWTMLDAARRVEAVVARQGPLPRPYWKSARRG